MIKYIKEGFKGTQAAIDPLKYFRDSGVVKKNDNQGQVNVKEFEDINVFAKTVDLEKSSVKVSNIALLEPIIMEYSKRKGLPSPEVVITFQEDEESKPVFYTIKIEGLPGSDIEPDTENYNIALSLAEKLKREYRSQGIIREMHLKDMIFQTDDKGEIVGVIPTDFERVKIDYKNFDFETFSECAKELGNWSEEQLKNMKNKFETLKKEQEENENRREGSIRE